MALNMLPLHESEVTFVLTLAHSPLIHFNKASLVAPLTWFNLVHRFAACQYCIIRQGGECMYLLA